MENKLREALDCVTASQELKEKTRAFIREKQNHPHVPAHWIPAAAACLLLLLAVGGVWLYFLPAAAISVDINPSLELTVNRFDRVIEVTGYGDGIQLAESLELTHLSDETALGRILESETVSELLLQADSVVTVTVIGENETQTARILERMETCLAGRENAYCYSARPEEVAQAHELGLSYGKYRAMKEINSLGAQATAEQIQGMTMGEIHRWLALLSGEQTQGRGYGWGANRER